MTEAVQPSPAVAEQLLRMTEAVGTFTRSYAVFAGTLDGDIADIPADLDEHDAGMWLFTSWFSGLTRTQRETFLGLLIALMVPLLSFDNTFAPENNRVPERTIESYGLIAVLFGIASFVRSTIDDEWRDV
jgi:hypothetical protein